MGQTHVSRSQGYVLLAPKGSKRSHCSGTRLPLQNPRPTLSFGVISPSHKQAKVLPTVCVAPQACLTQW